MSQFGIFILATINLREILQCDTIVLSMQLYIRSEYLVNVFALSCEYIYNIV